MIEWRMIEWRMIECLPDLGFARAGLNALAEINFE